MKPIVFFNIGWMDKYDGPGKIQGGGAYVKKHGFGHEILNFKPYNGFMYGFVQVRTGIHIERLGAAKEDGSLDDVLVVWTANDPGGGTYIVGWYDHATVYRSRQSPPDGSNRIHRIDPLGYYAKAKLEDCKRLSFDERNFPIPRKQKGGFGQANVWFADQPSNVTLKLAVLEFVSSGKVPTAIRPTPATGHSWQPDPWKRKKVEDKAIARTIQHYEALGYTVDSRERDNLGWDLEATRESKCLKLEVKGLSGSDLLVELTPNEYQKMQQHKSSYRICVVTEALSAKSLLKVFAFSPERNAWEDDEGNSLKIDEIVSARISLS